MGGHAVTLTFWWLALYVAGAVVTANAVWWYRGDKAVAGGAGVAWPFLLPAGLFVALVWLLGVVVWIAGETITLPARWLSARRKGR